MSWWSKCRMCLLAFTVLGLLTPRILAQAQSNSQSATDVRLPAVIPIFPLEEAVLFPGVSRTLNIFEPRYRDMVADAIDGSRLIGMVMLRPGWESAYQGRPPIYPIGCAGYISEFTRLPDGRYTIVLRGLTKFRVLSEDDSRTYRLAAVDTVPDLLSDDDRPSLAVQRMRLDDLLGAMGVELAPPTAPDDVVVNALAQYLDMETDRRQELLEINGPLLRAHALVDLLESR